MKTYCSICYNLKQMYKTALAHGYKGIAESQRPARVAHRKTHAPFRLTNQWRVSKEDMEFLRAGSLTPRRI